MDLFEEEPGFVGHFIYLVDLEGFVFALTFLANYTIFLNANIQLYQHQARFEQLGMSRYLKECLLFLKPLFYDVAESKVFAQFNTLLFPLIPRIEDIENILLPRGNDGQDGEEVEIHLFVDSQLEDLLFDGLLGFLVGDRVAFFYFLGSFVANLIHIGLCWC